jgi:hypothetical integral membrane protein (TIGR02206 family)
MRQLSGEHIAALVVFAIGVGAAVWLPRRHDGSWLAPAMRSLSLAILVAYVTEYVANAVEGTWSVRHNLPLQLTDAVTAVAVVALWRPRALLVEILYFWALTASVQSVLTPDLGQPFPSIFYFTYFATHVGAVVAAWLLTFGLGLTPRPARCSASTRSRPRWRRWSGSLTPSAAATYIYLRHKPERSSPLDVMGAWPWYILAGAAFGLAAFNALAALAKLSALPSSPPSSRA